MIHIPLWHHHHHLDDHLLILSSSKLSRVSSRLLARPKSNLYQSLKTELVEIPALRQTHLLSRPFLTSAFLANVFFLVIFFFSQEWRSGLRFLFFFLLSLPACMHACMLCLFVLSVCLLSSMTSFASLFFSRSFFFFLFSHASSP